MEIRVFVKAGYVSLECEGILPEPPRKIVFDKSTHIFTFLFRKNSKRVEFDCPMDEAMLASIKNHKVCGISCYNESKKLASALVPFLVKTVA